LQRAEDIIRADRRVTIDVWRLLWKINVVYMPLSPFVSFQSRFVTYLLTFPRTYISMYARTNRCYNERGSRTSYVRYSVPHCISLWTHRHSHKFKRKIVDEKWSLHVCDTVSTGKQLSTFREAHCLHF
jgi:hypothetical protein